MSDQPIHVTCPECGATNRVPRARIGQGHCGRCKSPLFPGRPIVLDPESLQRHLAGTDLPLLLDCWAEWCGPCRMLAPVLDQLAANHPGLRVGKLDTEQHGQMAAQLGIRSLPTLVLFMGGQEMARVSGALPLPQLEQWLRQNGGL
ncbi:MAG: thioredoxin TrxC [Halothiobacillaceae bacterium]